ncbi:MAG TPA: hypothetical protein VM848_10110 [Acidimicrobiia bacterium]|nr:hypothetical protein [Acidimicrobiia bacterium]
MVGAEKVDRTEDGEDRYRITLLISTVPDFTRCYVLVDDDWGVRAAINPPIVRAAPTDPPVEENNLRRSIGERAIPPGSGGVGGETARSL